MRRLVVVLAVLGLCASTADAADRQVAKLIAALEGKDAKARLQAAADLAELGPDAYEATPALIAALKSDDLALQHEAIIALGRIGPDAKKAVPELVKVLSGKSLILTHSALHSLRLIGPDAKDALPQIQPLVKDADPLLAVAAAWALVGIEPDSKAAHDAAIPVLIAALAGKPGDLRNDAALGLSQIGEPVIPAVIELLGKNTAGTAQACDVIASLGPVAKPATPLLLKLLDTGSPAVASHAALALGSIGADPVLAVPPLSKALLSPSAELRANAAYALSAFGDKAKPVVPAIAGLLSDSDPSVRVTAARALGSLGPAAAAAVDDLDHALEGDSGAVTVAAAEALGMIGDPAVPRLVARLKDKNFGPLAASVLSSMGPKAKLAVPALLPLLLSDNVEARREALMALSAIGPDAKPAVPLLLKKLHSKDDKGRAGAAYALVKILGKDALPELRKTIKEENDDQLQLASAWGLVTLVPENDEYVAMALPQLIDGLTRKEMPLVRKECASALLTIGPRAKVAMPELLRSLDDPEAAVRAEALAAIAAIDPAATGVLPKAMSLLEDPVRDVRLAAAYTLGLIGADAKGAMPALRQGLGSSDRLEKGVAAWALLHISPTPEVLDVAIPIMIAGLKNNPAPNVRIECAKTLGKFGKGRADAEKALTEASKDEKDETVRAAATDALKAASG